MLKFNASKRISINNALSHPYLASVREYASERVAYDPLAVVEPKDDSIESIVDCVSYHRPAIFFIHMTILANIFLLYRFERRWSITTSNKCDRFVDRNM